MYGVEVKIRQCLLSENLVELRMAYQTSSVQFGGYARVGYRSVRVERFRQGITAGQLLSAQQAFQNLAEPGVIEIKRLDMPEFSGLSFISKIRMFLDRRTMSFLTKN